MHSRQTFLHPRRGAITDGATEKGGPAGFWTSPRGRVGREAAKCASHGRLRRLTKRASEAGVPMLPRKASREPSGARTADRHRWAGRAYQGDRENHGQGTRQNHPATSGEGVPPRVEGRSPPSLGRPQWKGPSDCLSKTQDSAEAVRRCIGSDACPVPEGHEEPSARAKRRIQAPVNGGRNYNGPKVAKFLVG